MVDTHCVVDPEFHSLLPALTPDERQTLEQSILRDGCRLPVVVWKGRDIVVDGHNRYEICTAHRLKFPIEQKDFASRDEVKLWMLREQGGRRNLSESQRAMLAAQVANLTKGKPVNVSMDTLSKSRKDAAREFKVGEAQVSRAKEVITKGTPALQKAVTNNKVSVRAASTIAKRLSPAEQDALLEKDAPEIQRRVAEIRETKHHPKRMDDRVPPEAQEAFSYLSMFDEPLQRLKEVTAALTALCGDGIDRKPAKVGWKVKPGEYQEMRGHITAMRAFFNTHKPYAVCPYCYKTANRCDVCGGHKWVPEHTFNRAPEELRKEVEGLVKG